MEELPRIRAAQEYELDVLLKDGSTVHLRPIKGFPLLTGWRGADPGDLEALKDLLLRVSAMVEDLPEISEMDFNPVKVLPPGQGCVVVDTRILLRQP